MGYNDSLIREGFDLKNKTLSSAERKAELFNLLNEKKTFLLMIPSALWSKKHNSPTPTEFLLVY